jgi:hypothetical protein
MLLGSKHWIAKHENKNDFRISRTIEKIQMEEEINLTSYRKKANCNPCLPGNL